MAYAEQVIEEHVHFDSIVKRAVVMSRGHELVGKAVEIYTFSDGSQLEANFATRTAEVVHD